MMREGLLKRWIERDGLYLIALLLALTAIIYLYNGTASAVNDCNEYWQEQWNLEHDLFYPSTVDYIGQPNDYIMPQQKYSNNLT